MQRSEERIGGAATGGVAGTSSNVPGAKVETKPGATAEDVTQNTKSEVANYGVNKTIRHSSKPAGRVRRITAALLVDDTAVTKNSDGKTTSERKKWTEDELKQVRELAEATLGLDSARGDLVSVQNITFDQPIPQAVTPISRMERIRTVLSQWSSLLRYAGIILMFLATYALVIRPIKSQAIATMKELPARRTHPAAVGAMRGVLEATASDGLSTLGQPQQAQLLKQQVLEKVRHEPQSSSRLVQAWLREE